MKTESLQRIFLMLAYVLSMTIGVAGQASTGTLTGEVLDQNGAAVPAVTVRVVDPTTNSVFTTETNDAGVYRFSSLQPGQYDLTARKDGFQIVEVKAVNILTASTVTANFTLPVGVSSATLEVTAEASLLSPDTQTFSTTIENRFLDEIPNPERSALGKVLLAAGVQGDPGFVGGVQSENPGIFLTAVAPGAQLQVNGGRPGSSSILVDGSDISLTSFPRAGVSFSGDTAREVTIQQNGLSAQYGRTGGGIINQSSKGGTNQLRGNFSFRHIDPSLQARTHGATFNPARRQNLFGLAIGGPVFLPSVGEGDSYLYDGRDRTFFFVTVEPSRLSDLTFQRARLLTPDELAGRFNNSLELLNQTILRNQGIEAALAAPRVGGLFYQFARNAQGFPVGTRLAVAQYTAVPNNDLSAQLANNPIARYIFGFYPTPQNPGRYAQFFRQDGLYESDGNNALIGRGVRNEDNRFSFRIDHKITRNDNIVFRYTRVPVIGVRFTFLGPDSPANPIATDQVKASNTIFNYVKSLGGSKVNEFRITYMRAPQSRQPDPAATAEDFGANIGLRPATLGYGFPQILAAPINIGSGANIIYGGESLDVNLGIADDFSFTAGNHNLKIGGEIRRLQQNRDDISNLVGGSYGFGPATTNNGSIGGTALASFVLGIVNSYTTKTVQIPFNYRWDYYAAYIQDDWKVRRNLTVNVGLRWQLETPRYEVNNRQGTFDPSITGTLNGQPVQGGFAFSGENGRSKYLWDLNWKGFEPRVGLAYSPRENIVLRGAYSLIHAPLTGLGNAVLPDLGVPNQSIGLNQGGINPAAYVNYVTNPVGNLAPPVPLSNGPLFTFAGTPTNLPYVDRSSDVPYVQNWHAGVQLQFFKKLGLEIAYAGQKGTNLFSTPVAVNIPDIDVVAQRVRANANFQSRNIANRYGLGNMTLYESLRPYQQFYNNNIETLYDRRGNSIYHALYVTFRQRLTKGLDVNGSYTWSKSIDNFSEVTLDLSPPGVFALARPQDPKDFSSERSVSTFDIPQKLAVGFVYNLPLGQKGGLDFGSKLLNNIFGGFRLSGILTASEGFPLQVRMGNQGYFFTSTGGIPGNIYFLRPNIVPGVPIINPNWRDDPYGLLPGGGYLNPAAFAPAGSPGNPAQGNAPRTLPYARNPMTINSDASLAKRFYFMERRYVELVADVFNVINRANFFVNPNSGVALYQNNNQFQVAAGFGKISQINTLPGRSFRLGVRVAF